LGLFEDSYNTSYSLILSTYLLLFYYLHYFHSHVFEGFAECVGTVWWYVT